MIYQFQNAYRTVIERDFAPCDVPDFVLEDGVRHDRLVGATPGGSGPPAGIVKDRSHLAYSAPRRWTPGLAERYDKWNERGVAVVEGKADQRRFRDALRQANPHSDWKYDPD